MRAALLVLLAAALLAPAPAAAEGNDPQPQIALRLSYVLGPGAQRCPSEQTFRDEVARKMGYDPFTPSAPERVVITLTRSTRGSTATVKFNDAARARGWDDKTLPIRDDNCAALVTGVALYLTIQFLPFPSPPSTEARSAPPPPGLTYAFIPCKEGRCEEGKCVPLLKAGDMCDRSRSIDSPGACDYLHDEACYVDVGVNAWACGLRKEIGEACEPSEGLQECKSGNCDASHTCAPATPMSACF
jgi:hypothetical protein